MAKATPEVVTTSSKVKRVSKGERYAVDRGLLKSIRNDRSLLDRTMHKLDAWRKGKKVNDFEDWSRTKWPFSDKKLAANVANTDVVSTEETNVV